LERILIPGTNGVSKEIADSISRELLLKVCKPIYKVFPDGESYIRIPCDVKNKEAIVVQSFIQPQDKSFFEAILIGDALREGGASNSILIVPYMAYARQDKVFLEGEPISIRVIMETLRMLYKRLFVVEIHKEESLKYFGEGAVNISPYTYMARQLGLESSNVAVLSPDIGALNRAKTLSQFLKCSYDYLVKRRDKITGGITMEPKELDVNNKDIVIVDDIISTGGTIASASSILKKYGARHIHVLVAHAIMLGEAIDKLRKSGIDEIYAANTLPKKDGIKYVDIGPLIADYLSSYS